MSGRVKDYYWDQINEAAESAPYEQEPDDLEMLAIDAEQARQRYLAALEKQRQQHVKPV